MKSFGGNAILTLGLASLLAACGAQSSNTDNSRVDAASVTDTTICTDELAKPTNISNDAFDVLLGKFMGKNIVVENREGPVTYCFTLNTSSTTGNLVGTFRLDYVDDAGHRFFFKHDEFNVLYGKLDQSVVSGKAKYALEIIFKDRYGLIQVKGSKTGSGNMTATLRAYNFPEQQDQVDAAAKAAREACGTTLTYAQCLGYSYPQGFWFQTAPSQTAYQQQVSEAQGQLASSDGYTLGTMTFGLSQVMN